MSMRHDPELDDVLQDKELLRLGELLSSAVRPEPPLDDAFQSELRRQLMHQAWEMGEGRPSWWKRAFAPPGMAWIGATAGTARYLNQYFAPVNGALEPARELSVAGYRDAVVARRPWTSSANTSSGTPRSSAGSSRSKYPSHRKTSVSRS